MNANPNHNKEKGLIFNIQRFSIHDGPGIRTTVFFKGCPLRCQWCSNPESQDLTPALMVRDIQCRGCGACADVCPERAIRMNGDQGRKIEWGRCTRCLRCVDVCLYKSLNICGKYMDAEEIIDEVMKDKDFYRNSGGGVTISGGEPLSQSEFARHLLKACKEKGLHTALDTTAHAPWEKMEKVLPFVDLVLSDVKHLDSREHERTTGVGNELILENLKKVSEMKPVWLRVPLISGFNDSEAYMRQLIRLGREINVEKISLLPYHEGGRSKSEQMGLPYRFPEGKTPSQDRIDLLKAMIEEEGITAAIGN